MKNVAQPDSAAEAALRAEARRPWRPLPWHLVLLPVFFVLSFYSANMGEYPARAMLAPLMGSLLLAALALLLALAVVRHVRPAALVTALFVALFMTYGRGQAVLDRLAHRLAMAWAWKHPHAVLGPIWCVALALGGWLILRKRRDPVRLTRAVNLVALCLLAAPAFQVAMQKMGQKGGPDVQHEQAAPAEPPASMPHIVYVVLDGYARGDVLRDLYGYDNTEFLDFLRSKGFRILSKAHCNYIRTSFSQPATLNMTYLDALAAEQDPHSTNLLPAQRLIRNNLVCRELRQRGCQIVHFASGYSATDSLEGAEEWGPPQWLDEFSTGFLYTTAGGLAMDHLGDWIDDPFEQHRQRVLYALEHLGEALVSERPRFVYAHVICPHPPFVFGADGPRDPGHAYSLIDGGEQLAYFHMSRQDYISRYRDQLEFLNRRLRTTISDMLAKSSRPVVIVLQSDHGPGAGLNSNDAAASDLYERLGILSAVRFPDGDYSSLPDGLSAVNTFRVVLNRCLGTRYELLGDKCYISDWSRPYVLREVSPPQGPRAGPDSREGASARPRADDAGCRATTKPGSPNKADDGD